MAKQYANFIIISGETSTIQEAYSEVIYDIVYSTHKNLRATRKTQYGRGTNFVEAPLSKEEHIRSMYVFYEFSRVSRLTDAERDENYFRLI